MPVRDADGDDNASVASGYSRFDTEDMHDELMNEESPDEKGSKLQAGADSGAMKALFGALYTLAKEKVTDSPQVAMVNVIVDFVLILVIFLHLEYPWAVDASNTVFSVFFWLEIQRPLAARGLSFYQVIFYILCGMLYLSVGICVWVAWCFKNDSFPYLWPIKFVRIVASIFFGTFYIASINIFLTMAECVPPAGVQSNITISEGTTSDSALVHHIWETSCFEMPLLIHVIIALVSSVVFACVALLLVMADHELKPLSTSLLAAPHSMTELKSICVKTIITGVDVLMTPWKQAQAIIFLIVTILNVWWHTAELPYYTTWMNCLRVALYSVHAWICLCLVILVFTVDASRDETATTNGSVYWTFADGSYARASTITYTMFYGIAPAFFLGGTVAFVRLGYFFRIALRFARWNTDLKSRTIFKFVSETDVEVVSRVMRVWDEDLIPDPAALDLGELVIKGGLQQFPNSPFMRIVYANFLIVCREQMQSGWAQLELARKMHPNLSYRFSLFTWEQEHKQKAATSSTGNNTATDLVSYVEFQKNYKSLMMYHKAALQATRNFWRLVNNDSISLVTLSEAFRRIDFMKQMADKTYKIVLEKYPNSVKLLRAYAGYLETVNNDPWSAAKYFTMADKHEEDQENAAQDVVILTEDGRPLIDTKGSAVVTINSVGIIQSANKAANAMFGYQRGDLEKRNIKMLMPQPFSGRHDQFLANYQNTGKAKILDTQREVLGQHKENFVFPIRITVTRSSGAGADSMFMGVLKAVESDKTIIRAWLLTSGTVLCVDQNFIDYAGWASKDLLGHAFAALATDDALVSKMIKEASVMTEQELAEGGVTANTFIKHKYAEDVPVSMKFEMGGTSEQRLLVVTMKRTAPTEALAVFDHKGSLLFSNSVFASMLGYESNKIAGKNIATFIEQPYGYLHQRWIKDQDSKVTKPTPGGCRSGLPFRLLTSSGTHVTAKLGITLKEAGDHSNFCVKVDPVDPHDKDDMRRMLIRVNGQGEIVYVSHSPSQLFDFAPSSLVGLHLHDTIDIFSQWEGKGEDCQEALEALMIFSEANKGASWRVGVIPSLTEELKQEEQEERVSGRPASGLMEMRKMSSRKVVSGLLKPRPAVMQVVRMKGGNKASTFGMMDGGDSMRSQLGDAVVEIKLWRPDMLSGVLEVDRDLKIIKGDVMAAAVFGRSLPELFGRSLKRFIKAPSSLNVNDLMGIKVSKSGGMRKKHPVVGPKKQFEGLHADGLPLNVTLQLALKNGIDENKMVAMVKMLSTATGDCSVLEKLLYGENELNAVRGQASLLRAMSSTCLDAPAPEPAPPQGQNKIVSPVPPLHIPSTALSQLHPDHLTARGSAMASDLHTARDVEVEFRSSPSPPPRADGKHIVLRSVPELQDINFDGQHPSTSDNHPHPHTKGGPLIHVAPSGEDHEGRPGSEWDHVDPDHIPYPEDVDYEIEDHQVVKEDMTVSTHDDDDEEEEEGLRKIKKLDSLRHHELVRKRTFEDLEPQEQSAMKRSIVLVQQWLDSDYLSTLPAHDVKISDCQVPALVPVSALGIPTPHHSKDPTLVHPVAPVAEALPPQDKMELDPVEEELGPDDTEVLKEQPQLTASDFNRGKRLKRLLKLLSGRQATKALTRLRLHARLLLAGIFAVHTACFIVVVMATYQQYSYAINISSAGQAIVQSHLVATYNRDVEAATRGVGLNVSYDMNYLYSQLTSHLTNLESLHSGLYLGFNGKPTTHQLKFSAFWTNPIFPVSQFDSSVPPKNTTTMMSLWDLGGSYISSGRQVSYIAQQAALGNVSSSVASDRFWLFVRVNGAASLYQGYLNVLDQMLIQAQDANKSLKALLLALLVVEVLLILIGATGYILWLLIQAAKSRAALFTVFLFVPSGLLKSLANQSVVLADLDADPEQQPKPTRKTEESKTALSTALIAEGKRRLKGSLVLDDDGVEGLGVTKEPSMMVRNAPRAPKAVRDKDKRRASITWGEEDEGPKASAAFVDSPKIMDGMKSRSFSGQYQRQVSGEIDINAGIFNGKKLVEIWRDVCRLSWPFIAWGLLILASYIICLYLAVNVSEDLVSLKLQSRSMGQASRVLFYSNEVALMNSSDPLMPLYQAQLSSSSNELELVHRVALYGGPTLNDSAAHGAKDDSSGGIFAASADRVNLFFKAQGCLLTDSTTSFLGLPTSSPPCLDSGSMFHQAATHAIDPMIRRLVLDGQMIALDSPVNVTPSAKPYWMFAWSVARLDLIQSLQSVLNIFSADIVSLYQGAQWTVIAVMAVVVISLAAYAFFLLNPFLEMSFAECEAVAAMLAQLPGDLDVEEMVTASYNLVLEHHLDKKALHVRDPSFTQRGLSHMWDRVKSMSRASALILASNAGRDDLPQTAAGGRGSILALLNAARRKSNVVAPSPMEPDGAAAATNRRGSLLTLITAAQQSAMRKSVDAAASSNQVLPTSDPNYDIEMQAPSNASSKGIGSKRAQSLLHAHELLSDKQLFHPAVRSSVDLPMPPHLDNKALDPVSDPFSSSLYQSSHTVTRGVNQEGSNALSPEPPALSPSMDHDESAMKLQAMKMASGLLTDFGPTLNAFSSPSSATHKPMVNRGAATATSSTAADQVASALMALMENDDEPKVETN